MPCRTYFYDAYLQRFIIPNEKYSYLYLPLLSGGQTVTILTLPKHFRLMNVDPGVNRTGVDQKLRTSEGGYNPLKSQFIASETS